MNIIWKKPDSTVAITVITDQLLLMAIKAAEEDGIVTVDEKQIIDELAKAHAQQLLDRGDIPKDWEAVAFAIELPDIGKWRDALVWDSKNGLKVDKTLAVELTRQRLRAERIKAFQANDIALRDALLDNNPDLKRMAIHERDRLRAITTLATTKLSLEELADITVQG
jgi:hypothetical protein